MKCVKEQLMLNDTVIDLKTKHGRITTVKVIELDNRGGTANKKGRHFYFNID